MNARKPLEVVDGLRGPEASIPFGQVPGQPSPEQYRELAVPVSPADLPEGTVEYHSGIGSLWLHLSDGHKKRDIDSGYEFTTPGIDLHFAQGVARTTDPEVIHRVEGCKAGSCELHPKGLPAHAGFGLGKTIWRADNARAAAAAKQERDDVERFKANPEAAARLLASLESAGFVLPPKPSTPE